MEKTIKLSMQNDGTVIISNGSTNYKIPKDKREIDGETIYKIFQCEMGTKYTVETGPDHNENKDKDVFKYFYDLFKNIADDVNNITIEDQDEYDEDEEDDGDSDL